MPTGTESHRKQYRAAAAVLTSLWLTAVGACVDEAGDKHAAGHPAAADRDAEVEIERSEQALLGSAGKSPAAITQRNAIVTQPFAPQLLTPDGRLGLYWGGNNVTVLALGDPLLSVAAGTPRFAAKMANGQTMNIAPQMPGLVQKDLAHPFADPDGSTHPFAPKLAAGTSMTPWVNSGQGTLALDPRFSPGGKPFPVNTADACLNAKSWTRESVTSASGRIECYHLIHLQPFAPKLDSPLDIEPIALYQAELVVAVDARLPDTKGGVVARAASPNVVGARYKTPFAISQVVNANSYIWALEPSATADGRLLVTQRGIWTFNETPWDPRTWTLQTGLEELFDIVRDDVGGLRRICRRTDSTTPWTNCGVGEEEEFARVYTLAAQPLFLADGQRSSGQLVGCGYPWITPEGTDVFCRPTWETQPRGAALDRFEGFESASGMQYVSVGQHTGWMIRRVDGGINTRRFNPERLLSPPEDMVVPLVDTRPFSPLFLNTSTGFWAENRASQEASLPILRQWPVFQFMQLNHALVREGAKYANLGLTPSAGTALQSNMQYWEASFACSVNPKCLLHLPMNEIFYDLDAEDLRAQPRTADVSSNTDFFATDGAPLAEDGAPLAELHPYVGNLLGGARFIGEVYTAADDEYYMSGFRGTGISLRGTSAISISSNLSDPVAATTPCARSKGCLSGESFNEGFTAELAFLPLFNPSSSSLSLAQHHGLWSLKIVNGLLTAEVFYTLPNGTRASTILTSTKPLPFSNFFRTPAAQAPQWSHATIRVTPPHLVSLFVNGELVSNQGFPANAVFRAAASGAELIRVGPYGTCANCPGGDIMFVDELVFHKTPLRNEEIAASVGAFAGRSDLLTPTQSRRLVASFFSATNPRQLSLEADGFPRFVRAEDLRIPRAFETFAQPGSEAAFRRLVAVGNALFISPVLSTNTAGVSQAQSGTGQLMSCATCHNSNLGFTDGRVTALGLQAVPLNTPTIVNRAFGTNHLFGQGAASLLRQALRPVTDPREMNADINKILQRINTGADQAALRQGFAGVFGNIPVTEYHLQLALSAFQLMQLNVDSFAEPLVAAGQPVLDPQGNLLSVELMRVGKDLFEGKARCSSCHTGPNLSDELSHDTGVERTPGAFKTPTLWEVARTAPYFHDGSRATLRDVLNFYNVGGPAPARMTNGALRTTDPEMRPLGLTQRELNALETYLRTLQNEKPEFDFGPKGIVLPLVADFDSDGRRDDVGVWRPSDGTWYARRTDSRSVIVNGIQWGVPGDIPLVGDFDSDGRLDDIGVWRPSDGTWYAKRTDQSIIINGIQWGMQGDIPLVGDFDSDGLFDDVGVWRPSDGTWYARRTDQSTIINGIQWGMQGDIPLVGDFDSDGLFDDVGVWRPSDGTWYARRTDQSTIINGIQWGMQGDIPLVGDFDSDGRLDDIGVWRPSDGTWYARRTDQSTIINGIQWGMQGDIPFIGDFDSDGLFDDIGVWRPSNGTWYARRTDQSTIINGLQWGSPR